MGVESTEARTFRARGNRLATWVSFILATLALAAPAALAAAGDLTLVSRQNAADGGAGGNGHSTESSVASNGFVAFQSDATNLSQFDAANANTDVFLFDDAGLSLVSTASGGADGNSQRPSISADGRYVAFSSTAENISTEDVALGDVFVLDRTSGSIELVSRASGGVGDAADGASGNASISPNGRYVAFNSIANNLSSTENESFQNVFVRDLQSDTTYLASRASDSAGGAGAGADSFLQAPGRSVSDNGRVGFSSFANELSDDDGDHADVFLHDVTTGTTTFVSRATGVAGAAANSGSSGGAISGDGNRVAFATAASNLGASGSQIYVRDLAAANTLLVSRASGATGAAGGGASFNPEISGDGRFVVFGSNAQLADDNLGQIDIFVRDLQDSTTALVSRAGGPSGDPGNDDSLLPAISANGRFVSFLSEATNLSTTDDDAFRDVFVRDLLHEATALPPSSDVTAPGLDLEARKKQKLGKPVSVALLCDEACVVVYGGVIKAFIPTTPGPKTSRAAPKKLKLKGGQVELLAGERRTIRLKPGKAAVRKLKTAERGKATVTLEAQDTAGNTARERVKVALR